MLPEKIKFHLHNQTGVQLDFSANGANETITLTYRLWKYTSAGALVWSSEVTKTYSAADVANGAGAEFAEQDNSTDLYLGLVGNLKVSTDNASAGGPVILLVEWPTDGTTYPSDAASFNRTQDLMAMSQVRLGGAQTRTVPFSFSL